MSLNVGYLFFRKDIVVKTNYNVANINRGDVIYHKTPTFTYEPNPNLDPSEFSFSRVVALPGEKINIKDGQVYINDNKLATFYGAYRKNSGLSLDNIEEISKKMGWTEPRKQEEIAELKSFNKDEITVPEGHVYVIDDNWFRGIDSNIFGPLPIENIDGEVVGYVDNVTKSMDELIGWLYPVSQVIPSSSPLFELNGVTASLYIKHENHQSRLYTYVFDNEEDRKKGYEDLERKVDQSNLPPHRIYQAKNILLVYVDDIQINETIDKEIQKIIDEINES